MEACIPVRLYTLKNSNRSLGILLSMHCTWLYSLKARAEVIWMEKYYNGKLKSIEETKSLHFSLHSNYSCLHVRVADIVLHPSPQLHQSSIILQNSTQRCSSDSPPCWAEDFPSWWVHIVYMEIAFHLSQKFCLFSVEFCLSFKTLLYKFSDFTSHIKSVFQQWNIFIVSPTARLSVWQ